jgi:hypothetical protein
MRERVTPRRRAASAGVRPAASTFPLQPLTSSADLEKDRGDLRTVDLSRLAIRHAYLPQVEAQDASLADAHLAEAVLAAAVQFPCVRGTR